MDDAPFRALAGLLQTIAEGFHHTEALVGLRFFGHAGYSMGFVAQLRRQVVERAQHRCEYCHLHADDGYMPHEVDHIRAEKHGGKTDESNLCLACFDCNRHKGSDFASLDPLDDSIFPLFNPRRDHWKEHFQHVGKRIHAITAQGRVTVQLLQMNALDRLTERDILIKAGTFP